MQNKPRVDEGGKWLIQWESEVLGSVRTVYKPSLETQSAVRPKPAVHKTSGGKEYPKKGAEPG